MPAMTVIGGPSDEEALKERCDSRPVGGSIAGAQMVDVHYNDWPNTSGVSLLKHLELRDILS